jgi:hypothetical protein
MNIEKIIKTILKEIDFYYTNIKGKCKFYTHKSTRKSDCLRKTLRTGGFCEKCGKKHKITKVKLSEKLIKQIIINNRFKSVEDLFHTDFSKTKGISKVKSDLLHKYLKTIKDDYIHLFPQDSDYLISKMEKVYNQERINKLFRIMA